MGKFSGNRLGYTCTISRHYFEECSDENEDTVMHVFTDASTKVYGACDYVVSKGHSILFTAKKKKDLQLLTVPRLELVATVIGSRLLDHIMKNIEITPAVLWSESQIVLHWLNSSRKHLQ